EPDRATQKRGGVDRVLTVIEAEQGRRKSRQQEKWVRLVEQGAQGKQVGGKSQADEQQVGDDVRRQGEGRYEQLESRRVVPIKGDGRVADCFLLGGERLCGVEGRFRFAMESKVRGAPEGDEVIA